MLACRGLHAGATPRWSGLDRECVRHAAATHATVSKAATPGREAQQGQSARTALSDPSAPAQASCKAWRQKSSQPRPTTATTALFAPNTVSFLRVSFGIAP